ncbi:UNVERIFIED_CONTAM: hypothetical protein HDU68_004998, partial [Siphonaria sp. JEL0065]
MDYFPGNWGNPRSRDDTFLESNDYLPGAMAQDHPRIRAEKTMNSFSCDEYISNPAHLPRQHTQLSNFYLVCTRLSKNLALPNYYANFACAVYRQPVVTGTSVIGIRFKGGVMLAADNL